MKNKRCPRCDYNKHWVIRRGKYKDTKCKQEWIPYRLPLRLTKTQWQKILRYFILGLSNNKIARETETDKRRILRALNTTRKGMMRDIPDVFEGEVDVDETSIGGQWKNKRKVKKAQETKRGGGTRKQPVFGVICRNGYVWAELVTNVQADTLLPLIRNRVKRGSVVYSDTWKGYTGVASGGYVHRLVEHGKGEFSDKRGSHINGMEGFWGYLKRNLAAKGGILEEKDFLFISPNMYGTLIIEIHLLTNK